jgi:hypothetical protein
MAQNQILGSPALCIRNVYRVAAILLRLCFSVKGNFSRCMPVVARQKTLGYAKNDTICHNRQTYNVVSTFFTMPPGAKAPAPQQSNLHEMWRKRSSKPKDASTGENTAQDDDLAGHTEDKTRRRKQRTTSELGPSKYGLSCLVRIKVVL